MSRFKHLLLILALGATHFLAFADKESTDEATDTCDDSQDEDTDYVDYAEYYDENGLPLDWEEYKLEEFWELFECDEVFGSARPIHNESTWMLIRGTYLGIVGLEKSKWKHNLFDNGFAVQYKVAQTEDKGRGVHAAEFVKEGTLVWESHYTGCFEDELHYRKFLVTIPYEIACDVMQWAYVESSSEELGLVMCCDLDEGSLINTGRHDYKDFPVFEAKKKDKVGEANNLRIVVENGNSKIYAVRDINIGEEFLVDYNDFAVIGGEEVLGYS